jgi:hypothetical protein
MIRLALTAGLAVALLSSAAADDPKPIELFNGKDLTGWKLKDEKKNRWFVGSASANDEQLAFNTITMGRGNPEDLTNTGTGGGCDIFTKQNFGDIHLELEFMIPKGSNSGIYLMGEYEVQILDSFGKRDDKLTQGDLGALYSAAKPPKNAAREPGVWQKFVIDFQAPTFEGGKKVANAKFVKVTLNDVVLHENVEMKGPTPGGLTGKEAPIGPLMFQGDHGPVAFRNIKIIEKK